MQSEIPDVVLPEPILPPCLAYEIGWLAKDDVLPSSGGMIVGAMATLEVPPGVFEPVELTQVGG